MVRTFAGLLIGAVLTTAATAQEPTPPPPSSGPVTVTTLPHPVLPEAPLTAVSPGTFEDCNGPLLVGDPLLDGQGPAGPGWVADLEVGFVKPHFINRLTGSVAVGPFVDTFTMLNAPLSWTVSPRIELGYRFGQGFGEFLIGYRALVSQGNATVIGFDALGNGSLRSRLNLNSLDLDYGQHETGLGPCWDVKWRVGVRLLSEYHDSNIIGGMAQQSASNHFLGAGPHASVEVWRDLGYHRLALFGRLEGSAVIGQIGQQFGESFHLPGFNIGGVNRVSKTQGAPEVNFEAGVAWMPWEHCGLRFEVGYQIEGWWYLASTDTGSRGDLGVQGVFLRGSWAY